MTATIRARRRRGAIRAPWLIAMLLLASAALRLGAVVPAAMAEAGKDPPADTALTCTTQDGVMELLEAVRHREVAAESRELELAEKERSIELAMVAMTRQREALVAAEESLAATLAIADSAADEDVARLVTVYENMKPKETAPLFEEMDAEFAAGFIARMKPGAAAAVLAGMDPQKAYLISVVMAGRNAGAPTE